MNLDMLRYVKMTLTDPPLKDTTRGVNLWMKKSSCGKSQKRGSSSKGFEHCWESFTHTSWRCQGSTQRTRWVRSGM